MSNSPDYQRKLQEAARYLSNQDAVLGKFISILGVCKLKPHKMYFKTLVSSIVSQQLSLKAAETIFSRFKLLFRKNGVGGFPEPGEILSIEDAKLRACGLSNAKVKYVKDLSTKVIDGTVKIHLLGRLPDEEIINELVQVKGIGVWSADMFLIFCLGRLDVLPVGDLGLKRAVMINYKLRKFPSAHKLEQISNKYSWYPYRTVAAWYHWQSLKLDKVQS
jgi:DNA-3-methyladenine glycosylase II